MGRGVFRGELDEEQRAIFALMVAGKTRREIALSLGAAPDRVEAVIRRTCRQLDTTSRLDAVRMIASHYGWTPVPPPQSDSSRSHKPRSRNATDDHQFASNMVQAQREQTARSSYVRNVGNEVREGDDNTGVYGEVMGRITNSKIVAASSTTQRVLLIALLITSSALALSALISVMQGFDKLFFS